MEEIREAYPRPQFERKDWMSLNGAWDFRFDEEEWREIRVPFAYQAPLSGIGSNRICDRVCYRRRFRVPERWRGRDIRLHFGAVDYQCRVLVNGRQVGEHTGGNIGFSFDITEALTWEEEEITVLVWDPWDDEGIPRGKQYWKKEPESIWYTRTTGIWQTVWLEPVSRLHLESLRVRGQVDSGRVEIAWRVSGAPAGSRISFDISLRGEKIASLSQEITEKIGSLGTDLFNAHIFRMNFHGDGWCWTPEHPTLFDLEVRVEEGQEIRDEVRSYFGIREIEAKDGIVYLNHRPYYQKLVLDQGYWPEGLLTPPAPESYADDILAMKKLGFNTLRKHIKVEMEEFYYQCDKLGMIVWQDMVNNSDYNFIRDTALPTIGIQKLDDRKWHMQPGHREGFKKCAQAVVNQLKNHPSICYWTIFNEAWGQFDSDNVYDWFRTLDDTRFIDTTSGWFRRKKSDVDSRHVYFRSVKLAAGKKPLVLSEFGGYSWKPAGHVFNDGSTYGYGKYQSQGEFADAVESLYNDQILPCVRQGLCAAIYTQVSDVEDETNGLVTYDRKVEKLIPATMRLIARTLQEAVRE